MPYLIDTLQPEPETLQDALCALCEAREADGWALVTMAAHPVPLPHPAGMAATTYVTEWVLVFMRD
jgi:hypothetical protein